MTRRMDLILAILEQLEKDPNTWSELPKTMNGYTEDVVSYHVEMCSQAGFIHQGAEYSGYTRLAWHGHDKLDELRATVKGFVQS